MILLTTCGLSLDKIMELAFPRKGPAAVCSFLTSGKYVEKQQRGLFGVGFKMIAPFSPKDTDHPLRVWTKTHI